MLATFRRRAIAIVVVGVGLVIGLALTPVAVPLALIVDLCRNKRRFGLLRVWCFGVGYLTLELTGILAAAALWIGAGFGTRIARNRSQRSHRRVQLWWVRRVLVLLRRVLGLRFDISGAELVETGPLIVLSRHASLVDTLFPALTLGVSSGLDLRYVLKRELRSVPTLDLFGSRLPNHFADRSGADTAAELDAIAELGSDLGPTDAVVIFPEGTRWTPEKFERAISRLRERGAPWADRAAALTRCMPPRLGGTNALLDAAPDADVVVFVHRGLDGLDSLGRLVRSVPFTTPVEVELWRIPRSDVPDGTFARGEWLMGVWEKVDRWVRSPDVD